MEEEKKQLNNQCIKHPDNEYTFYCLTCQQMLCIDCGLDHDQFPDHKTLTMPEITKMLIKDQESISQKLGSADAANQQLKEIQSNLESKIAKSVQTAKQIHEKINKAVDLYIKTQLSVATEMAAECNSLKEQTNAKIKAINEASENISMTKKLLANHKYDELVKLFANFSKQNKNQNPPENGIEMLSQKIGTFHVENFEAIAANLDNALEKFCGSIKFVYKGCGICKENIKLENKCIQCKMIICNSCIDSRCEKCNLPLCKKCVKNCVKCNKKLACQNCIIEKCVKCDKFIECRKCDLGCEKCKKCVHCLEKCLKCNRKICKKCHSEKCEGKYMWVNGSDTIERKLLNSKMISTDKILPNNGFEVELNVENCDNSCYVIGITEKSYDGKSNNGATYPGWKQGLTWKEYGWAACSCSCKSDNGNSGGGFGKQVINGIIKLILDNSRNLSIKIDGVSQGILFSDIPKVDFYLTIGNGGGNNGKIKILSVKSD